jgi:hypothetical protein
MNEDHERTEELLAGYVLLGLSGEDAMEADRLLSEHVPSCPLCRDQVAGFQAVAGDLALAVSPAQPPDLLLPRIRRGVAETPVRRRNRASLVAVAAGVAAIVGVAGLSVQLGGRVSRTEQKPEAGPTGQGPGLRACRNDVLGIEISYPEGWYTTSLVGGEQRPEIACNYFDPKPLADLGPEPPPVALEAHLRADPLNKVLGEYTDPEFATTLSREETDVGGRPAVRFEVELTGQGLLDKGTMQYGYAIDLGPDGTFVVLTTAPSASDPEYATNKEVVDRAATTFKLL